MSKKTSRADRGRAGASKSPWRHPDAEPGRPRTTNNGLFVSAKHQRPPPTESWWAKGFTTREEFDEAQRARSRQAGWTGRGKDEQERPDR